MRDNNEISEEEISRDWTIDTSSKGLINRINKNHRLWFAMQLCFLKRYGLFLENPGELSTSVISYLGAQLRLRPTFIIEKPQRKATYLSQRKLIFEHLKFKIFNDKDLETLLILVVDLLDKGIIFVDQLCLKAEQFLIENQIALPSTKQLKRWIKSLCSQHYSTQYKKIYQSLPQALIIYIDKMLVVENDDAFSWFNQLKEYPGTASISTLKQYLAKYQKLCEVTLEDCSLFNGINQGFINHHYQLARYYSADKIKRFNIDKRYTLMAIFLFESKKYCIDYLVQLHDQYISDICRECNNANEEQKMEEIIKILEKEGENIEEEDLSHIS